MIAIPDFEIAGQLLLAAGLGAVLGFDREALNRAAGLRTHMLVCLAAAVFTAITFAIHRATPGNAADPLRIVEAVTAGVAFLAAGAIIQSGRRVIGVTTGAGLWLTGAVGVAAGAGQFGIAVMATLFALVILIAIGWLERHYLEPFLKNEQGVRTRGSREPESER